MARAPNRIRHFRQALGLSAGELADRVGMAQSQISRLENGKQALTAEMMIAIGLAIGIAPGKLLDDDEFASYGVLRGALQGKGALYGPPERKLISIPPLGEGRLLDVFVTDDGWLVVRLGPPRYEDNTKPFLLHYGDVFTDAKLEIFSFENTSPPGGFSKTGGHPSERWLAFGDDRIMQVWRILAVIRRT